MATSVRLGATHRRRAIDWRTILTAAVAIPPAALALISAMSAIGDLGGRGMWPAEAVTLAEAAATRNSAEVLRLVGRGHDPSRRERVRAALLSTRRDRLLTPLEAAVWTGSSDIVRLLLDNHARADRVVRDELRCLANEVGERQTRVLLDTLWSDPPPSCRDFDLPGRER